MTKKAVSKTAKKNPLSQKKKEAAEKISKSAMNEPEIEAAKKADEEAVSEATAERLNLLLGMVSRKFNLDDTYTTRQFKDSGKALLIALENEDFIVSITVKDSDRHGLFIE